MQYKIHAATDSKPYETITIRVPNSFPRKASKTFVQRTYEVISGTFGDLCETFWKTDVMIYMIDEENERVDGIAEMTFQEDGCVEFALMGDQGYSVIGEDEPVKFAYTH